MIFSSFRMVRGLKIIRFQLQNRDGEALMNPSSAKRSWGDLEPLAQNAGQQFIALNDEQVCQAALWVLNSFVLTRFQNNIFPQRGM